MARSLSYKDAAKLLGAPPKFLQTLDRITAVGLLAAIPTAPTAVMSLFDARSELVRTGQSIISSLHERFGKTYDYDEASRLVAAHSILVITSYFEVLHKTRLPVKLDDLELTKCEQALLANARFAAQREKLIEILLAANIPAPSPAMPYEDTRAAISVFYEGLTSRLLVFISGLAAGQPFDLSEWQLNRQAPSNATREALRQYDENFRKLAAEMPNFWIWANLQDHQATRQAIRKSHKEGVNKLAALADSMDNLHTGLGGVEKLLSLANIGSAGFARSSLAISARAELDWPIVDKRSIEAHAQIEFPRLGQGYINPSGRVVEIDRESRTEDGSWWKKQPFTRDIQATLTSSVLLTTAPIVILGEPGAGKSLLTRVLAARLAEAGILSVRVELRHVTPTGSIQRQIEEGVYQATGEATPWPELSREAGETNRRVVLLDGLDELIQVSGAEQSDYLEKVEEFQKREHKLKRPTTVIVTSRTVVAARTRFPESSIAIRIEPFSDEQIDLWLRAWADANREFFANAKIAPLTKSVARSHGELARQPLLLLMLALYDTDGNPLQRRQQAIALPELYEGLLSRFAKREITLRDKRAATSFNLHEPKLVERELHRLALVALGMHNRARQWISFEELSSDFSIFLGSTSPTEPYAARQDFHERLTEADHVINRFFFIHESRMKSDTPRRTYEFLHLTFSEYLVARLILRALIDYEFRLTISTQSPLTECGRPDSRMLRATLSFELLTARPYILTLIKKMLGEYARDARHNLAASLVRLLNEAFQMPSGDGLGDYHPQPSDLVSRAAVYSANLVLLIAALQRGTPTGQLLFPFSPHPSRTLGQYVILWASQLQEKSGWLTFIPNIFSTRREIWEKVSSFTELVDIIEEQ